MWLNTHIRLSSHCDITSLRYFTATLMTHATHFARSLSGSQLTHWGRDNMAAISQTTFSSVFSRMKMFDFDQNFTEVFLINEYSINGSDNGLAPTSHCLNQWWLVYWSICAWLGLNELSSVPPHIIYTFRGIEAFRDFPVTWKDGTTRSSSPWNKTVRNPFHKSQAHGKLLWMPAPWFITTISEGDIHTN